MGIMANWNGKDPIKNAYLKVVRIWGSKEEGWHASVGVFKTDKDVRPAQVFHIHDVYIEDKNPFDIIYAQLGKLSFLNTVSHDVSTKLNAITIDHINAAALANIEEESTDKSQKKKKSNK